MTRFAGAGRFACATLALLLSCGAHAAGFDCSRAWGPDEKLVCATPAISHLDDELGRSYRAALDASFGDARKGLQTAQRAWLAGRKSACNYVDDTRAADCLADYYRKRIEELGAAVAYDSGDQATAAAAAQPVEILRMTPSGEDVPAGRQIVLQFNQPMVPVGDMRRDAAQLPITIAPAAACEWRWINTSALACQLTEEHALKPSTRYTVAVRPGLRSVGGGTMKESFAGSFITVRPQVTREDFVFWLSPTRPIIRVAFSVPVTRASVAEHVSFTGDTLTRPVATEVHADGMKRDFPVWMKYLELDRGQPDEVDDEPVPDPAAPASGSGPNEARSIWLVVPDADLPKSDRTPVSLTVTPGLATPLGPEKGVENRDALSFYTFPEFRFLGIRCVSIGPGAKIPHHGNRDDDNDDDEAEYGTRYTDYDVDDLKGPLPVSGCDPLTPVMLRFSSPVMSSQVKRFIGFSPRLDGGRKDYDPWANVEDYTHRTSPRSRHSVYGVWLPELLKAAQNYHLTIPVDIADEFGRHLPDSLEVAFDTAHREPRLVIDYRDIVLEKGVDSEAIAYVNNLNKLHYDGVVRDARFEARRVQRDQPLANIQDISYRIALLVRDVLDGRSGYTHLCITSTPSVSSRPECLRAQVTPYQVHVKLGHFSSLAWVTDLHTGEPVPGAKVEILLGSSDSLGALPPAGPRPVTATVLTGPDGVAELPGTETLDPALEVLRTCCAEDRPEFFVRVTHGDDLALVPLDYGYSAQAGNGIWPDLRMRGSHASAWGYTTQGVYRGGDAVDMKVYFRDQSNLHWVAPEERTGYTLRVVDPTGNEVWSVANASLDAFGTYTANFRLAPDAVAGWYEVQMRHDAAKDEAAGSSLQFTLHNQFPAHKRHGPRADNTYTPMRFLVSDFTPAPFRTESLLKGDLFRPGDAAVVSTRASLYSGGPFARANARVSAEIEGLPYTPGTEAVRGYTFGSWSQDRRGEQQVGETKEKLNAEGQLESRFELPDANIYYGRLNIESAVMDDRGKYVTARTSAVFVGRDRFVGIRTRGWLATVNQDTDVDLIVADPYGKPVADSPVEATLERRVIRTARVQGPGNAYLLRNTGDWEEAGRCTVRSRADSSVSCRFHPTAPGDYRVLARVKDSHGREYLSEETLWVVGDGWVNWANDNDGGLEIVAENDTVKTGSVARYLVKNPYPGARALVTVERYGVIQRRVQVLKDSASVIEIPVTRDMAPGFYLSVVVMSPRVAKPIENEVDLGKPAFRMGYVRTKVVAPDKQVKVSLVPARNDYRPREQVVARLKAELPAGAPRQPLSVAVLAIDESVLALNGAGTRYYDAYEGFNSLDPLDLQNWDLLTRLIGRQKIEKKGANPGGDGGHKGSPFSSLRDQFRYVALWQGDVKLDAQGGAEVKFAAPDNLTGWRLLAVAVTPEDMMGLGQATVRVNRPTEIRPAMPNQVMEGDRFTARITVLNRTGKARVLKVHVEGTGAGVDPVPHDSDLALAPWEQKYVEFPVQVRQPGEVRFRASAADATDSDALAFSTPVKPRRIKEVAANYGTTTEASASDSLAIPQAIYPDASVLSVTMAPTALGNLDGAFRYVIDYPYLCWEQRLDKALMYAGIVPLKPWLKTAGLPADPPALVRDMLDSAASFQAPNGGMTYWQPQNGYVSPYLSAYTALGFSWLARSGYKIPQGVVSRLHDYLRNMLRENVFPDFYDPGMESSVRAVALAALADSGDIDKSEVQRYQAHMPRMSLLGKAHFLQAQARIGASAAEMKPTLDSILAMSDQTGGKFQFLEKLDDNYSELLATPLRDNCAVLSGLLDAAQVPGVAPAIGDIPFKLVRMITQSRGNRDHFENTQENVFCSNALIQYARRYEREAPDMKVRVRVDAEPLGEAAFRSVQDPAALLRRPLTEADRGRQGKVVYEKSGTGRLYYSTRLEFAPREEAATSANNGIEVVREYSIQRDGKWRLLGKDEHLARGDLVRVDLFVRTPGARHFVVVDDPVPGALEPVNTALATDSQRDDREAKYDADAHSFWFSNRDGWMTFGRYGYSFYHREIRHDAVRFYADLLPAGSYHLSYSAQVIAEGRFAAQPVFAGEMYDIDVFGRGLPTTLSVDGGKP